MGILDEFTAFTQTLSPERLEEVEGVLRQIMVSETAPELTAEQNAELERRLAEPNPEYVSLEMAMENFRSRLGLSG